MTTYRLAAFDMDGTLLNSDKKISEKTMEALHRAAAAGKIMTLCTGRSPAELADFRGEDFTKSVPYAICESGALIVDLRDGSILSQTTIDPALIPRLLEAETQEDVMLQIMTCGRSVVSAGQIPRMEHYQISVYQKMFEQVCTKVPSAREFLAGTQDGIEKVNFYHTSTQARERTRARLRDLPLNAVDSEVSSLELTPLSVTKAAGLEKLCAHLGIPMEETVAVGDAPNDMAVLRAAGFAAAMGNAGQEVREICALTVSDNDHDGCAEVIDRVLLHCDFAADCGKM